MADETTEQPQEQVEAPAAPEAPASPTPVIVTAAGWRAETRRRWRLDLPSGVSVVCRRIDPATLMWDGAVSQEEILLLMQPANQDPEMVKKRIQAAQRACVAIVTTPAVGYMNGEPLPEDVMDCLEIPAADAMGILAWSMGTPTMVSAEEVDGIPSGQ